MSDGHALVASEGAFVESELLLARASGSEMIAGAGVRGFLTGTQDPFLNVVLRTRLPTDEATPTIRRLRDRAASDHHPLTWWVTPGGAPDGLPVLLEQEGFELRMREPLMTLDLAAMPAHRQALDARRVDSEEGLLDVLAVLGPTLSPSEDFTEHYGMASRRLGLGPDAPVHHLVTYRAGGPVGMATLIVVDDIGWFHALGVTEPHRRQGIARDLSLAILALARELGCRRSSLLSSDMSLALYRSLGSTVIAEVPRYRWMPEV